MAIDWDAERTELDHFNTEYAAELAAEQAEEANAPEFKMVPERYSDDWLTLKEMGIMRGWRNSAADLRKLDTVERRSRAVSEAYTILNIVPGQIFSGAVYGAVRELLHNIESGNESKELHGERFAREAREAEAELRRVTGNPNAIHNPFRR